MSHSHKSTTVSVPRAVAGLAVAFAVGAVCRLFGIPSPAPPMIMGALLVMAMTVGHGLADYAMKRSLPAENEEEIKP